VDDLTIRPATRDDAAALTALLQAADEVDHTELHEGLEDVEEMLANPMVDLAQDWLVAERDGEVVASAELWPRAPADGEVDLYVGGTVRPDHRGQGLGTLLLQQMMQRAVAFVAERSVEVGEPLSPRIRAETVSTNQPADDLLRAAGFVPRRFKMLMHADLTVPLPPAPELPAGYTLLTWEGADHREVRAAHNRAFGGFHYGFTPWDEQMWRQWVQDSAALRPAMSLLLRDQDGAIAAYVQSSEYDGVTEATGVREAFVAKVGTVPEHRRRGLAGLLLSVALGRYVEAGYAASTLDVDAENPTGALGIYERAGYRERLRFALYELAGT
jgi:mycothiol synthase